LPINPGTNTPSKPDTPNTPSTPDTPSKPETPSTPAVTEDNYPTVTNPLDKRNMTALKTNLYSAQLSSNTIIPKDTREEDGKVAGNFVGLLEGEGVKVAVLDADFQNAVRTTAEDKEGNNVTPRRTRTLTSLYLGIEILTRINSQIDDASSIRNTTIEHGEEVLEVIRDMDSVTDPPQNKIGLIVGSLGQDYHNDTDNKSVYGAILPNKETYDAALAAFARGIGFIPLVFSTAIVTGVYSPAGATFVFVVGMLLNGNPLVAFIAGAALMFVEVQLLALVAKGLDKFPGIREMGEHIRTAMNKVLEVALLVGGAIASEKIAPGIGYFWVIGLLLLNRKAKSPIVELAIGPVAAISLGIIVNILYMVGLFTPVAG